MAVTSLLYRRRSRGAALIVVLSVILFLTVIIVAMTVAMRLDNTASHYYSERARASFLVQEAAESAKAILLEATSTNGTSSTNGSWISTPSSIFKSGSNYSLFSGTSSNTTDPVLLGPDLNRIVLSEDKRTLLTGSTASQPMRIGWIYVFRDGSRSTNQNPDTTDRNNPIVGRFAFWAEDQSAKINLNTAWKRSGNTNEAILTSQVNLTSIPGITEEDADAIHDRTSLRPLNAAEDTAQLGTSIAQTLSGTNRALSTYYSHSDNLNPWGEQKIYLTTQKNNLPAALRNQTNASDYFLDILSTDNADPGIGSNLVGTKITAVLNRLLLLLDRPLPSTTGTFVSKYGRTNAVRLAVDIIDYVRSAESAEGIVPPIRMSVASNGSFIYSGGGAEGPDGIGTNVIIGSSRRPMLTEMTAWSSTTRTSTGKYTMRNRVEFCVPKRFGIPSDWWTGKQLRFYCYYPLPDGTLNPDSPNKTLSTANTTVTSDQDYDYVEVDTGTYSTTTANAPRPDRVSMRVVILGTATAGQGMSTGFWELAPSTSNTGAMVDVKVNDLATYPDAETSSQVLDPRMNKYRADWTDGAPTRNSLQRPLPGALGQSTISADPPQDSTASGLVSDAGLSLPPPKGSAGNPHGRVLSVAELGFIPTGVGASVPWRTLRLQPSPGLTSIPDWTLLDLFAAPEMSAPWQYAPRPQTVGGKINLNTQPMPFAAPASSIPLQSVLRDARSNPLWKSTPTTVSEAAAQTMAANLSAFQLASGGRKHGSPDYYHSVGEIAEIAGISDQGEESEEIFRQVFDELSVQGNVYRVFSIGQALQQTPNGKLVIQAEKSSVSFIERYLEDGKVKCRTLYWRTVPL